MVSKIFVCPDGSIPPQIATGNTMAPCVIIGERAARSAPSWRQTEHLESKP